MPEVCVKSNLKTRFRRIAYSAKKRNIKVNLPYSYYEDLINLGCSYCGESLLEETGYSLDRVDNNRGYIYDNVTPCCKTCNQAKGKQQPKEFFEWIEKAYKHQKNIQKLLSEMEVETTEFEKEYKSSREYLGSEKLRVKGSR